jgi:hypothetical protein
VDYKYFNGTYGGSTEDITPGQTTTIGLVPIMFESKRARDDEEAQSSDSY